MCDYPGINTTVVYTDCFILKNVLKINKKYPTIY